MPRRSDDDDDYDSRRYMICRPWYGKQGGDFTERFAPDFKAGLELQYDKYATLRETLDGTDAGGAQGDALPSAASDAAGRAEMMRMRSQRLRRLCAYIRLHVVDPDIQSRIDDEANSNGIDAWAIVEEHGQKPANGLTKLDQDAEWTSLRLTDVGIDERSILKIKGKIHRLSQARDTPKSEEEKRLKFLSMITFPTTLASKAVDELHRPTITRVVGTGGSRTYVPDYEKTVKAFDELWRHASAQNQIRRQAPPERSRGGHRVDAFHVDDIDKPDEPDDDNSDNASDANALTRRPPRRTPGDAASLQGDSLCNNCLGFGHHRDKCPSTKKDRKMSDVITVLTSIEARKARTASTAPPPPNRPHRRVQIKGRRNQTYAVDLADDGQMYIPDTDTPVDTDYLDGKTDDKPDGMHFDVVPDTDADPPPKIESEADPDFDSLFDTALLDAAAPQARTNETVKMPVPITNVGAFWMIISFVLRVMTAPFAAARGMATTLCILLSFFPQGGVSFRFPTGVVFDAASCAHAATMTRAQAPSRLGRALIDSGTTCTASNERSLFPTHLIKKRKPGFRVRVASGNELPVEFVGTLVLRVPTSELVCDAGPPGFITLNIDNAFYVPDLCTTLISTKGLFRNNQVRTYLNDELYLRLPRGQKIKIHETPRNYTVFYQRPFIADANAVTVPSTPRTDTSDPSAGLLHARLGHASYDRINASKPHVHGLPDSLPQQPCPACHTGGARAPSIRNKVTTRVHKYFGECIASDLCEMPATSTPFHFRYMIAFYDLATKYLDIYYLRTATAAEVRACFELFLANNHKYLRNRAITWLTDNGSEFFERNLDKFLRELLIRHKSTVPNNPQTNPSERVWGLLLRPLRVIHASTNASEALWPWTINQLVYIHNSLVTSSSTAIAPRPPHTLRSLPLPSALPLSAADTPKPDVSRLRVLYCRAVCYLRGDAQERSKLAPRLESGVHLGIDQRRGGYFVYFPSLNRLTTVRSADVAFYETEFPPLHRITGTYVSYTTRYSLPSVTLYDEPNDDEITAPPLPPEPPASRGTDDADYQTQDGPPSRRLRSSGHLPDSTGLAMLTDMNDAYVLDAIPLAHVSDDTYLCFNANLTADVLPPPRNVGEIDSRPDAKEWKEALLDEYKGKMANNTFTLVKREPGMKVLKTKIVFNNKLKPDQTIDRRKCRWVGCGYAQIPDVHYDKTYQATAKSTSVRLFFSVLAFFDLDDIMIDVVKAYTHSKLDMTIYCEQMPGFIQRDPITGQPYVCKLLKALEGLKQAGYLWQQETIKFMTSKEVGFRQLWCEPCMFVKTTKDGIIIALVWVDDFAIGYNNRAMFDDFYSKYSARFNAKLIDKIDKFVGILITRDRARRQITLKQTDLVEKITGKFFPNPSVLKTIHAPAWFKDKSERTHTYSNIGVATSDADNALKAGKPYLSLVASILYIACMTRPDISFYIAQLCRYMSAPSLECYTRAEELLAYVYHTRYMGLIYGGTELRLPDAQSYTDKLKIDRLKFEANMGLHAYSDASWKVDDTYAGHVILANNAAIDWSSKLLKVKASSAEAEISAGCLATKRIIFVRNVMTELLKLFDKSLVGATPLLIDNSAAIELSENVGVSKKTEHFKRWQHTLRDETNNGVIKPLFVRTKWQTADILTKVVSRKLLWQMRDVMINRVSPSIKAMIAEAIKASTLG